MNIIVKLRHEVFALIQKLFDLDIEKLSSVAITINIDKEKSFGDLSCNAAMVLSKILKRNPRQLAQRLQEALTNQEDEFFKSCIKFVEIAGPGFLNITLNLAIWQKVALQILKQKQDFFKLSETDEKLKYLVEFVSVNPTGPMHLGAGRNAIIGDVISNVLSFLGHDVHREYYINDAGNQIKLLGKSLQARCIQELGGDKQVPDGGYVGDYLIDIARECVKESDKNLLEKEDSYFIEYAKVRMLKLIKSTLESYGIMFDEWFSEKSLHESGSVTEALEILKDKKLAYEYEGALWFKATEFGDDKDRVIKRSNGEMTYIAADVAYHKNKFDRGYDRLIDILGQDHHGYVKRLKATMQALGYDQTKLDVILYQLVSIKENNKLLKMSKRAGTFTKLSDVLEAVGRDVTRFFYLNRKAEAHLDFDLSVALKKTEENPVFYIQYAYVRTRSLLEKAEVEQELKDFVDLVKDIDKDFMLQMGDSEIEVVKKIILLQDILKTIGTSYQTHLLAYYAWELANKFHSYYARHRIIDTNNIKITKLRLLIIMLVRNTLKITLKLLGVSAPERM